MKDRILEIMKIKGMTQQEFAAVLDISPASLSNIFNGKTNPTNNHVVAIHKCFPNINISWLMFGEGNMFASSDDADVPSSDPAITFDEMNLSDSPGYVNVANVANDLSKVSASSNYGQQGIKMQECKQRKIIEIRVFFDDGTYDTFLR